ncbi:MAG: sialate O-acetylesterase [Opitutaceae bacterium]|jgi:sialate O-acetylesterase|nr:sialate O-acetylesterase [Opitutaceae bacterium]
MQHRSRLRHAAAAVLASPAALARAALALTVFASPPARADITPASLFQDHAVLQRDLPIPVWGRAAAGEKIRVSLGNAAAATTTTTATAVAAATATTTANSDGRWLVHLPPLPASATPRNLVIEGENAADRVVIRDVLVGEVWLCAGQSNMGMQVKSSLNFERERAAAANPLIRSFRVGVQLPETPAENALGKWLVALPETVGDFSATAYFFAREIQPKIGVPVGIISTAHGNTAIAAWRSAGALAREPSVGAWWKKQLAAKTPPRPHRRPSACFNGMLHPLAPCAVRGFLWYQGEGDATVADVFAPIYARQLSGLVAECRQLFNRPGAPFFWVNLAGFGKAGNRDWTGVRHQQNLALATPGTAQAVAYDIGDETDIHPKNKQETGRRLALLALRRVYDFDIEDTGPVPVQAVAAGQHTLRLRFNHAGDGLRCDNPTGEGLFELASAEGEFFPATSLQIGRDTVVVRSAAVPAPARVRYAWQNLPKGALANSEGLPAAPFLIKTAD